jgi:prevent-host-death family protein
LRRRGWTASDIEKELGIPYAEARRYVRRSDAQYGRPAKTIRNARKTPQQASIREIRQNLSALLKRVKAGETLEVVERGRPVALLVPRPPADLALDRLIASGRVIRPAAGRLSDLGPPPKIRLPASLSDALQEMREDRF